MKCLIAATLAGFAVACAGRIASGPPAITLGVDVCDSCGMAISEARYAAAVAGELGGEPRVFKFDDIGCLARWETKAAGFSLGGRWVHDRNSERWLDSSAAIFVRSASWTTPMGSGIAAFSKSSETGTGAESMTWDQVLGMARRGELDVPMTTGAREESR